MESGADITRSKDQMNLLDSTANDIESNLLPRAPDVVENFTMKSKPEFSFMQNSVLADRAQALRNLTGGNGFKRATTYNTPPAGGGTFKPGTIRGI